MKAGWNLVEHSTSFRPWVAEHSRIRGKRRANRANFLSLSMCSFSFLVSVESSRILANSFAFAQPNNNWTIAYVIRGVGNDNKSSYTTSIFSLTSDLSRLVNYSKIKLNSIFQVLKCRELSLIIISHIIFSCYREFTARIVVKFQPTRCQFN